MLPNPPSFAGWNAPGATTGRAAPGNDVVGPLFGRRSRNGYDMRPDTKLTTDRLRRFFTPWRYAPLAMVWDGKYVSMQPVVKGHRPPVAWAARAARFALEIHGIRIAARAEPVDPITD